MADGPRVQAHGKELKFDGRRIADCSSEEVAKALELIIDCCGVPFSDLTPEQRAILGKFYA